MAPMRAQASMREHRLRHHRHIEDDAVALVDAEVAQHGAEQLHLGEQAAVGEGLLGVGDRANRRSAPPGCCGRGDVAVERVVAGVATPPVNQRP